MTDKFDDRRRGLEEEYFHKKNQEALEKMRAKIEIAEQAKAAGTSSMNCPRCDGSLQTNNFEGVDIDTCEKCGGVWLDSGELEQLTKRESGWFSRLLQRG
ncbi:MAG: zf-TFIIB domain-containing protein [Acidobacteriota bacterium]|nr:zf-TFIIB domain-containing protein [Acidobacteriota bacterium]